MSGRPASLEQIQRWMQSVITHPGGVEEGLDAPATRAHLDIPARDLASVIAPSARLDSTQRLEIYVDAYHERLLECLREEFTATRAALGGELFEAVAFGYLQHYPSHSYTLGKLGASFPRYLAESRLHERAAPAGTPARWADFVIELAAFERSQRDVFDGPGSEGLVRLDLAALAKVPGDRLGQLRFVAAPCLRLHRFDHPVHVYWTALKNGEQPVAPQPSASCLAINRREYQIERHALEPSEFSLLERLAAGDTLNDALRTAAELPGARLASLERDLGQWFARWAAARFLTGWQV